MKGITRIEDGPAHYTHKVDAGAIEFPLVQVVACTPESLNQFKAKLLVFWSKFLHLTYNRGFRARLLKYLGIMPGPLMQLWIKTRL